jgi:hypothetical protein
MRIDHLVAAAALALLASASWAQTASVFDPTGSHWIDEQIAAARRAASAEADSAAVRRLAALRVASTKDDAPKTAESSRPGHVTQPSTTASVPSPAGTR